MRVALDVDGVLFRESPELWIEYYEAQTGRVFDRQCFARTHSWSAATGLSPRELSDLYVVRHLLMTAEDIRLIAGAVTGVGILRQLGSCHIVTARDCRIKANTMNLLETHFDPFDSYEFGHVESKVAAMKNLGATVLVEDSAYQAQVVADSGLNVIFFPQPRSLEYLENHRHPRIIYPAMTNELSVDMSEAELDDLHIRAWQEIIDICCKLT